MVCEGPWPCPSTPIATRSSSYLLPSLAELANMFQSLQLPSSCHPNQPANHPSSANWRPSPLRPVCHSIFPLPSLPDYRCKYKLQVEYSQTIRFRLTLEDTTLHPPLLCSPCLSHASPRYPVCLQLPH